MILKNYIKNIKEPKILYKKGTGVLLKNISGNIKKEKSEVKKLNKGNKWGLGVLIDPTFTI